MDIGYMDADGEFSLRSAAIIEKNHCVLLAKSDKFDCFYTVGGGIQNNETSAEAILRECYEETGLHFTIDRLSFIHERFYSATGIQHHEVTFFYLMQEPTVDLPNGIQTDQHNEHLFWIPVNELENINVVPTFLKTALKNLPKNISHIVSHGQPPELEEIPP